MWGFFISSILFISCGLTHDRMPSSGLVIIYFASSFFGQCGPNSTTFLIPAGKQHDPNLTKKSHLCHFQRMLIDIFNSCYFATEIFPTEMRTMCHGISAAFGKVGALLAAILFNYTNDVHIFLISGYTSLLACLITFFFIPESCGLDLFELDRKWNMIVYGNEREYRGPVDSPHFCSLFEKHFSNTHLN